MDRIRNPELQESDDPRRFIEGDPNGTPATPLDVGYLNGMQEELLAIIEASGQTPDEGDNTQLLKAIKTLTPEGVDVQVFTKSGTWKKPKGAQSVHLFILGGGQGGAHGKTGPVGTTIVGGVGGGGGTLLSITVPASQFSSTASVVVATGGKAPLGASGASRVMGGMASFCADGASAQNGTQRGMHPGASSPYINGTSVVHGVSSAAGPAGGGGGSIHNGAWLKGGSSHSSYIHGLGNVNGCNGETEGASGSQPSVVHPSVVGGYLVGCSGGGGAASLVGNGGDGGKGDFGAGGGGGGAAYNTHQAGLGGDGGDGLVIITTFM